MLSAFHSMTKKTHQNPELPRIGELDELYTYGAIPRRGEVIMIAGRSGSQKSGFALWYSIQIDERVLYMSADMNRFQASSRAAQVVLGKTMSQIEAMPQLEVAEALEQIKVSFNFDPVITWDSLDDEIDAHVEVFNEYPGLIVIDNLMDVAGGQSDYGEQMEIMQDIHSMSRELDTTIMILHHATDKTYEAKVTPWLPPARTDIKGGMTEKPELIFGVGLDPGTHRFNVAVLKNRSGPSDPSGKKYIPLRCEPERTSFYGI